MPNRFIAAIKGSIASVLLATNVLVIFTAMIPPALIKAAIPSTAVRKACDHLLNALAQTWVGCNGWWIALMQRVRWDVSGLDKLKSRGWYLVSSNHQSWVDILVLQKVFSGKIPFLKFFLKRELIYVPVMGLAWWALDFPFMRRQGDKRSMARDMAETRKSCERFKLIPTSVINFMEGTRFSAAKHAEQKSPYRNLLRPKLGGMTMALATMGDTFDAMLDVTIVYPRGVPTFWDLLSGKVSDVIVRVNEVQIPADLRVGERALEKDFRVHLQSWVGELWSEKDRYIDEIKTSFKP
ncbi:acyltransferase [Aquabacterium sp.]|uniref:acyltransferase n=1 Tax=Aquabacterium sp. TaxID=1872578 RepID=UPI0035AF38D0